MFNDFRTLGEYAAARMAFPCFALFDGMV